MNGHAVLQEVEALHACFARWLGAGEGAFADIAAALDPSFEMVMPDGVLVDRGVVLDRLRAAKGSRGASFAIAIEDASAKPVAQAHALAAYVERQEQDGRTTSRRASAILQMEPRAPRGFLWLHVHETWM